MQSQVNTLICGRNLSPPPPPVRSLCSLALSLLSAAAVAYVGHHDSLLYASKASSQRRDLEPSHVQPSVKEVCLTEIISPGEPLTTTLFLNNQMTKLLQLTQYFIMFFVLHLLINPHLCPRRITAHKEIPGCLALTSLCLHSDLDAESISCTKQILCCVRNETLRTVSRVVAEIKIVIRTMINCFASWHFHYNRSNT